VNLATIIDPHPADAVALISRGQETTYGTLREQVAAVRGGLVGLGMQPGDRLAILAGNNWYFVVSYLAALGAGMVAVPRGPPGARAGWGAGRGPRPPSVRSIGPRSPTSRS
jgi:long-chain acyl-CoA synthetase